MASRLQLLKSMKTKFEEMNPDLQLMEISFVETPRGAQEGSLLTHLEWVMTNSAMGFEYAKQALNEEQFGPRAEQIQTEIEQLKATYFQARERMGTIDPKHLNDFETALQTEKSVIFTTEQTLH